MGFNASPFSGRNTSVSTSANKNFHPILNDPDVLSLERLLRVKSKVELRLPGRLLDPPPVSVPLNQAGGCNETVGENERITGLLQVDTALAAVPTAGEFPRLVEVGGAAETAAHATAGDCEGIVGLHVSQSSFCMPINSLNSSGCVDAVACARLPGVYASASSFASAAASLAVVAHARSTPMHIAHNSWSDTARNSRCIGGLLPVCKSTSDNLEVGSQRPRVGKTVKEGGSGPAEDLRLVSEVEPGVNFRLAGSVRRQVAGSLPGGQPGVGTRTVREGADTHSLRLEVPDTESVPPGYRLDIRQSMGCTKVCQTARSGIWLLKGNARTCMLPENLDHLRVGCRKQGSYETAWVTPGRDCLCSYHCGHGAAVRPRTKDSIWDGFIGLWGRVAPLLSPWKLIVSVSLGHSVVFQVRRVPGDVPSSITLDHGDLLGWSGAIGVCTLHGVWAAKVLGLTLLTVGSHDTLRPVHLQAWLVVFSQRVRKVWSNQVPVGWEGGENKWSSSWGLVLLLSILVFFLLVNTWIHNRGRHRHSCRRPSRPAVHFVPVGLGDGVGDCHDAADLLKERLSLSPSNIAGGENYALFSRVWFISVVYC